MYINKIKTFLATIFQNLNAYKKVIYVIVYMAFSNIDPGACRSNPVPLRECGPEMYTNKIKTFLAHLRNQLNAYKKLYML